MGGEEGDQGYDPAWAALIAAWAPSIEELQAVWFFGSRARDRGRTDSDLDIAIRTQGPCSSEAQGHWMATSKRIKAALAALLPGVRTDAWGTGPGWGPDHNTEQEIVWPAVLREGVLIWEAWPGAAFAAHEFEDEDWT